MAKGRRSTNAMISIVETGDEEDGGNEDQGQSETDVAQERSGLGKLEWFYATSTFPEHCGTGFTREIVVSLKSSDDGKARNF